MLRLFWHPFLLTMSLMEPELKELRTFLKKIIAFCMLAGSLWACRKSDLSESETVLKPGEPLTLGDAAELLLNWTGLSEEVLGVSEEDRLALAHSLGMLGNEDPNLICSRERLSKMKEIAEQVKAAMSSESLQPLFLNGMAQPIFPYSDGTAGKKAHAVIRFCIYVETDYDTDKDGKRDLIKAVVQLPEAAARGDYQAAVIYEARPYSSGCTPFYEIDEISGDSYDLKKLYAEPAPRVPVGEISTLEAARNADVSDWYYYNPYEDRYMYEDLDWYDYFLVRGYAVVLCAGLGTYQSEGFQTCGSELEIAAFRSVIEWLIEDRKAYADLDSDLEIKADWCNGSVGMTGMSYAGATQFGVAGTGVRGLKTIVPVSGIASWYEYVNSQGAPIVGNPGNQLSSLALYCAGRYLDSEDWKTIEKNYGDYLHQLQRDQRAHGSDYSAFWRERDYTLHAENLNCSALIVQGLNDDNVKPKQADLMARAFVKAGMPVKLLLHQDAHVAPVSHTGGWTMLVNGEPYEDLLNRWFSHFLYGIENRIEEMPAMLVQNGHDPEQWDAYDTLQAAQVLSMHAEQRADRIISSGPSLSEDHASWRGRMKQGITIRGSASVAFDAAVMEGTAEDALIVKAALIDTADEPFPILRKEAGSAEIAKERIGEDTCWQGAQLPRLDLIRLQTAETDWNVITEGWIDLCNPESGYESASSEGSILPVTGEDHTYQICLQPEVYHVPAGHELVLVLSAPGHQSGLKKEPYSFAIRKESVSIKIPCEEEPDGSMRLIE